MNSKRSHEGYFMADHRQSPGVPDALIVPQGLPVGSGHGLFEAPTFTCSHCQAVVVLNPDRSRSRGYCKKCDHYICDGCEAQRVLLGGTCYTFKAFASDTLEAIDKGTPLPTSPFLP